MHKNPSQMPIAVRAAELRANSFDADANTIEVVWSTGAKVRRFDWRTEQYFDEELVMSPNAIRLDRLNAGAAFLNTHASFDLSRVLGCVVEGSARIEAGKGVAKIRLSTAPDAADAVHRIKEGTVRNISVGYRIHRVERTRGEGDVALWRVVDWEPTEISAVPVPADAGAQIRSDEGEQFPVEFVTTGAPTDERSATEIRALGDRLGQRDLAEQHIADGSTLEAFRTAVFDKLASGQTEIAGHTTVTGPSNADRRADAITNALLHRHDMAAYKLDCDARDFRGMTLVDIARDCLETAGISTRGFSKNEVVARAVDPVLHQRSGGYLSTTDFPSILANVANKTLRAAYDAAPQTFRPFTRITSVSDFKPVNRVQMGEAPRFEKVNEHGEFKSGSVAEGKETYAVATYGRVVAITRQVIINDDLAAFTRIPGAFGVQAANLESDLVWAQLVGNPVMGDGVPLFHASHGNLGATAGIAIDPVSAGREAMRMQRGLDGRTFLNLTPKFLIAPVAAETKVAQLLHLIRPAQIDNAVPEYMRSLTPITEPRLDGGFDDPATGASISGSRFAWFLAADPAMIDTVELAYLEGQQGVYTETRMGFDIDGVEIKVRMDAAAKVIDWRAFYKNPAIAL